MGAASKRKVEEREVGGKGGERRWKKVRENSRGAKNYRCTETHVLRGCESQSRELVVVRRRRRRRRRRKGGAGARGEGVGEVEGEVKGEGGERSGEEWRSIIGCVLCGGTPLFGGMGLGRGIRPLS